MPYEVNEPTISQTDSNTDSTRQHNITNTDYSTTALRQ